MTTRAQAINDMLDAQMAYARHRAGCETCHDCDDALAIVEQMNATVEAAIRANPTPAPEAPAAREEAR